MRFAKSLSNLLVVCCFATHAYADVSYTPAVKLDETGAGKLPRIKIYGQIKQDDVRRFIQLKDVAAKSAKSLLGISHEPGKNYPLLIELDSPGGSVTAAIAIGKQIRETNPMYVVVEESASCVSACVFVLAGGVTRYVDGQVGIHRPYLADDKAYTVSSQKKIYAEIEKNVKDYLSFVNVPTSLYDTMFRIPPEKVRFLSRTELQEYNLNEDDPYYKEANDANLARIAGLTKVEYIRRIQACNSLQSEKENKDCQFETIYGRYK